MWQPSPRPGSPPTGHPSTSESVVRLSYAPERPHLAGAPQPCSPSRCGWDLLDMPTGTWPVTSIIAHERARSGTRYPFVALSRPHNPQGQPQTLAFPWQPPAARAEAHLFPRNLTRDLTSSKRQVAGSNPAARASIDRRGGWPPRTVAIWCHLASSSWEICGCSWMLAHIPPTTTSPATPNPSTTAAT